MFSGHLVATTNITTRMTSGMICTAVMVCSGSVAAPWLRNPPPSTRAARPRIASPATTISRIRRRRLGRGDCWSRVSSRVSVGRCAVLVMAYSSLSGSREDGRCSAAGNLGEVDDGGGDGAGGAVDADEQASGVVLAPGFNHPGGGPQP